MTCMACRSTQSVGQQATYVPIFSQDQTSLMVVTRLALDFRVQLLATRRMLRMATGRGCGWAAIIDRPPAGDSSVLFPTTGLFIDAMNVSRPVVRTADACPFFSVVARSKFTAKGRRPAVKVRKTEMSRANWNLLIRALLAKPFYAANCIFIQESCDPRVLRVNVNVLSLKVHLTSFS